MGPGLAVTVSVPHAVSLVALVTLKVVSRAVTGSNLGEKIEIVAIHILPNIP